MKNYSNLRLVLSAFIFLSLVSCIAGIGEKPTQVPRDDISTISQNPTRTRSVNLHDIELHHWIFPESRVADVNWMPNSDRFVAVTSTEITMYDASTYQAIWTIPSTSDAKVAGFMPDGKSLVIYIYGSGFQIRDTITGKLLTEKKDNNPVDCFQFKAHDGVLRAKDKTLYLSVEDQSDKRITYTEVHVWDMKSLTCEGIFLRNEGQTRALDLSTDGKFLALSVGLNTSITGSDVSEDGQVTIWNLDLNQRACSIGHQGSIGRFNPSNSLLLVSDPKNNQLAYWDMNTCQMVGALKDTTTRYNLAFSPDGQLLAVWDEGIRILDANSGEEMLKISDPVPDNIFPIDRLSGTLSFSYDGHYLLYSIQQLPYKGLIFLWSLEK